MVDQMIKCMGSNSTIGRQHRRESICNHGEAADDDMKN